MQNKVVELDFRIKKLCLWEQKYNQSHFEVAMYSFFFSGIELRKSVSSESGLNKRQKDKKCHLTLGKNLVNGGTLQESSKVLLTEIKSIPAPSVNLTPLPLNTNFPDSKQELRISRNVTGNLPERK